MLSRPFESFLQRLNDRPLRHHELRRARRRIGQRANTSGRPSTWGCAAETLEDRTLLSGAPAAQPAIVAPISPAQMRTAYGVNQISFNGVAGTGAGQTIAIVVAYHDANIIGDAQTFSSQFGIPQFNLSGGPTLQVLNEVGGTNLSTNGGGSVWTVQESVDVEWAHVIAPQANIIVFEANSNSWHDLGVADQTAAGTAGVSVVLTTWMDGDDLPEALANDSSLLTPSGHQGVTFLSGTGDYGSPAEYPAVSPNVIAVGGTTLNVDSSGNYLSESAWTNAGGGISIFESQAPYQKGKVNGASATQRTVPDISMDADPNTGVDVVVGSSVMEVGGTSLSSAMMAGLVAIANQGRALNGLSTLDGESQTLPALYDLASDNFHDTTTGNNGRPAGPGYDLATGLGTPLANVLVPALARYQSLVTAPASITVVGSSAFTFSGGSIAVNDPAAIGASDSVSLSVADGTLALGSTVGLTFLSGANGSSAMTVSGTQANLNAAINGLAYTPTAAFPFLDFFQDFLQVSVNNAINNQTGMARVNITVNGPPLVDAINQLQVQTGSHVNSGFLVSDPVASGNSDMFTLGVANGTLAFGSTTGLTFLAGSNGSSSITVTGTVQNLDVDLGSLIYTPNPGFIGTDSLQISAVDSIDNLAGAGAILLTVYSTPAILAPLSWSASQDQSGSMTGVSIFDPAASGFSDSLTLSVTHGTLSFGSTNGIGVSGSNTSSVTVIGTLANINTALTKLFYAPTSGFVGSDVMQLSVVDANNGTSAAIAVPITVFVRAPNIAVPEDTIYTIMEDGFNYPLTDTIRLTDWNSTATSDSLTLSVTNGIISFPYLLSDLTVTAGAVGSSSVTLTGWISDLNFLANEFIQYTPNPGFTGPDPLQVSLHNSVNGLSAANVLTLNVIPGAFVYGPGSQYVAENTPYTFPGTIHLIDRSAVGSSDSLILQVGEGSLTLPSTTGLTFTAGANNSSSMTVTGTLADLNSAVADLVFTPGLNFDGQLRLSISGYNSLARAGNRILMDLEVTPPPIITAPSSATLNENSSFAFSGGSIDVVDNGLFGNRDEEISLSVNDGSLLLSSTNGLTWTAGANGSSSMTVTGWLQNIDAALNGLIYTPNTNYSGADTLEISFVNLADTLTASAAVALTINAPPVIAAPQTASLNENGSYTFSGSSITLADASASGPSESLTIQVSHATLTLASTTGLTFSSGSNGSAFMTILGTLANVNAALNGLAYRPTTGYVGSDSLSLSVTNISDNLSASASIALSVIFIPPPTISAPASETLNQNASLVFSSGNNDAITVADSGPGANADSLKFTVGDGTVTLPTTAGLTVTAGANGSSSITVTGSVANLNAALNGLIYKPMTGYSGSDALAISVADAVDALSASASVALTINNPPAITAPATASVLVTSSLTFSAANKNAISIADVSAGTDVESLVLRATNGTLTLGSTSGITVTSGANASAYMTLTGTLANLNNALSGLIFKPVVATSATIVLAYTDVATGLSATSTTSITIIKSPLKTGPAATVGPTSGGTVAFAVTPASSSGTLDDSTPSPDTQLAGFAAAVHMLAG